MGRWNQARATRTAEASRSSQACGRNRYTRNTSGRWCPARSGKSRRAGVSTYAFRKWNAQARRSLGRTASARYPTGRWSKPTDATFIA